MTEILPATDEGVLKAAALLRDHRLVSFGTETVYGLGGDATCGDAVATIFEAKGRPRFNPLICHYPSADEALAHVIADVRTVSLAQRFWPGPLTLVLRRAPTCPVALLACAGLDTVAVRVPAHPIARSLLQHVGRPVAAPSANRSGRVSPTKAAHVLQELSGRIDAILDSGACPIGIESTVLDLSGVEPVLLRPGGVTVEMLTAHLGSVRQEVTPVAPGLLRSPGQLASHYAPSLPVRLEAEAATSDEVLLAFGPPAGTPLCLFNLSPHGSSKEAAARLFEGLRWLDTEGMRLGAQRIAVMAVPDNGIGRAINDRLRRAAAPRPTLLEPGATAPD